MRNEIFDKACRENTGRHLLDSGDYYGRHWQNPPLAPDRPMVTWGKHGAIIDTALFLATYLEPIEALNKEFNEFCARDENAEKCYASLVKPFMKTKGLVCQSRNNVYNGEQDLSQVYIWAVYTKEDDSDWVYADDEAVTVIEIHTGCDVRGGYAKPIFCRALGEYQVPVDLCCGYRIVEAHIPLDQYQLLDERWQIGYSLWPAGQVKEDVERIFEFTRTVDTVCALLKTGEVVKIQAYSAAEDL